MVNGGNAAETGVGRKTMIGLESEGEDPDLGREIATTTTGDPTDIGQDHVRGSAEDIGREAVAIDETTTVTEGAETVNMTAREVQDERSDEESEPAVGADLRIATLEDDEAGMLLKKNHSGRVLTERTTIPEYIS